jgi:Protein of unknown function (DUF3565)
MQRKITGFHQDEEGHWVAELECGHNQHVRHDPPFVERPWVTAEHGRQSRLGQELNCARCDEDRCATAGSKAKVTRVMGAALVGSRLLQSAYQNILERITERPRIAGAFQANKGPHLLEIVAYDKFDRIGGTLSLDDLAETQRSAMGRCRTSGS